MICNHIPKWGTLINIFKPFLLFYLKKNFTFGKFWAYAKANRTVPITQSQNHQPMASSAPSSSLPTSPLFLSKCILIFMLLIILLKVFSILKNENTIILAWTIRGKHTFERNSPSEFCLRSSLSATVGGSRVTHLWTASLGVTLRGPESDRKWMTTPRDHY